jgi:hypothetical protein
MPLAETPLSEVPVYVGFSVLFLVLGVLSIAFRRALVEWHRSLWNAELTRRDRQRREGWQAAVGAYLILAGVALLIFGLTRDRS